MDDGGPTASILIFLLFLILDAVVYGFGAAVQNLNIKEEEKKISEGKSRRTQRICSILKDSEDHVLTVQVIVSFVNLAAGAVYLKVFNSHIRNILEKLTVSSEPVNTAVSSLITAGSLVLTMLLLLYILIVFGVFVPKKLAVRNPEKWAYRLVDLVWFLQILLKPFTALIKASTKVFLHIFGMKNDTDCNDVTEDEIISMVNEGHEQGVIQASEAQMITNIFEFGDKEAQDIMTNRRDMIAIDGEISFGEAVEFMLEEKYSRYPVYEDNIDHIKGILHMKDALRMQDSIDPSVAIRDVPNLLRQVRFVPETRKIDGLFKTMQLMKLQMVIVVDEYGQTSGLIAMEDILEEIVGSIMDEYDEEEENIQEKGQDEYVIEGKTRLEELEKRLGITFEEEEFETVNGFLISKLEHIPEPNQQFSTVVDGFEFKISEVENRMITQVLVTRTAQVAKPEDEENTKPKP